MPKAASPIRLQEDLMRSAAVTGKRFHRSTAEQIEYWASLGRQLADILNPDTLLCVTTGLARVRVEPILAPPIDPDAIFHGLEEQRRQGTLPATVTASTCRYQASRTHPGYLEHIDTDGTIGVGRFEGGRFIPVPDPGA